MNLEPINPNKYLGRSLTDAITELVNEINDIKEVLSQDEEMRMRSPALQDAWEQYQSVKRLVK